MGGKDKVKFLLYPADCEAHKLSKVGDFMPLRPKQSPQFGETTEDHRTSFISKHNFAVYHFIKELCRHREY